MLIVRESTISVSQPLYFYGHFRDAPAGRIGNHAVYDFGCCIDSQTVRSSNEWRSL
jgi:hypothetical protein